MTPLFSEPKKKNCFRPNVILCIAFNINNYLFILKIFILPLWHCHLHVYFFPVSVIAPSQAPFSSHKILSFSLYRRTPSYSWQKLLSGPDLRLEFQTCISNYLFDIFTFSLWKLSFSSYLVVIKFSHILFPISVNGTKLSKN